MNVIEYFKYALAHSCYLKQEWVIRAFSVTNLKPIEEIDEAKLYKGCLVSYDTRYGYYDGEQAQPIEGSEIDVHLLDKRTPITLLPGELSNVSKKTDTHIGKALFNALCLVYPFGDTIAYINDAKPLGQVEKLLATLLVDEPKEGGAIEGKVTPSQLRKYLKATAALTAYSTLFVPTVTKYTMTPAPKALKRMKELLAIHKDELTNPAIVAAISKEIVALDKEYIAQDPHAGLYQKDKSFTTVRMNKFYMHGLEIDFEGINPTFIPNSLDKGWDLNTLPQLANNSRDGSFSRGAMTALGGEKTKTIFRVLAGVTVVDKDCNTTQGLTVTLTKDNVSLYQGAYILDKNKTVLLDDTTVSTYLGKTITVRSPGYCQTPSTDFCIYCMGEFARGKETAMPALSAEVGSTLMLAYMKAMHVSGIFTNRLDLVDLLE